MSFDSFTVTIPPGNGIYVHVSIKKFFFGKLFFKQLDTTSKNDSHLLEPGSDLYSVVENV